MGYYESIYGSKGGKKGLLEWIKDEVKKLCYGDQKSVSVHVNTQSDADEIRKGNFPSILIYPVGDSFEKINDLTFKHKTTVRIISTTKGSRNKTFRQSVEWSGKLYDHFRNTFPDLEHVRHPAVGGNIDFSWEGFSRKKHRNLLLSHSAIDLIYEWRL